MNRHARSPARLHLGLGGLSRRDQRTNCNASTASNTGNCQVRNVDRTVHQGLEIGFGAAITEIDVCRAGRRPTGFGSMSPTRSNDFRFDGDESSATTNCRVRRRHYPAQRAALQAPERHLLRPQCRMGAAGVFRRQREHHQDDSLCLWGLKLGYDNGGPFSAYIEGRNLSDEAYIASASITTRPLRRRRCSSQEQDAPFLRA